MKSPETLRRTIPETKQLNCRSIGIGSNLTSMIVPVYLSAGTGVIKMLKAKSDGIEADVTVHTINGGRTRILRKIQQFDFNRTYNRELLQNQSI